MTQKQFFQTAKDKVVRATFLRNDNDVKDPLIIQQVNRTTCDVVDANENKWRIDFDLLYCDPYDVNGWEKPDPKEEQERFNKILTNVFNRGILNKS
jgi:hypothetical protein